MKFLVVGCGSIGRRHIGNLISLSVGEVIACDIREERLDVIKKEYRILTYANVSQALDQGATAALICTPNSSHIPIALQVVNAGLHLFIEKPLSHTLDGVDELIETVRAKNLVALVACNLRFFASLELTKRLLDSGSIGKVLSARASCGFYLPYWHPEEDYRESYTARRSLGGGIILDDIHELDYLTWLLGEVREVFCFSDKVSSLEMETEDVAAILLKFESGALAELHVDCLQHTYRRSCELIGEKGIIIWDYIDQTVKLFTEEAKEWQTFSEKGGTNRNQMFIEEMKHFIGCVRDGKSPLVDGQAGKRVLEIALACKESSRLGKAIAL